MDAYEFAEATDVFNQIPASFFTAIESKKWSERKEALEVVEKATAVPKIAHADFNELVRVLRKVLAKDANIVVATLAAKCLCQIARGLRTNFAQYSNSCLTTFFEKFKEKKPNVISVLREAADAAFVGTNLENILEDVIAYLDNKNPQIKAEMSLFLTRTFSTYPEQVMNKKTLRPLINALIKALSDMDATVRDNAAMAIGTAMKVSGEKLLSTMIADVEPIKVSKIKEFCEKAEIKSASETNHNNGVDQTLLPQQNQNGLAPQGEAATTNGDQEEDGDDEDRIYEMLDAVDISGQIPASFFINIESKKWSERKEALEIVEKATAVPKIANADFTELVRVLKKTLAKDANIVVATSAAKCLCQIAKGLRFNFAQYSNSCLATFFEKFKEKKPNVISVLREGADAAFVGTNLESILEDVTAFLDNKNPQIKAEMSLFLARTFAAYPAQVMNKKTLRPLINALIKALSDMDSTVRDNAAMAIGTAMKVTGEKLMSTFIADVEPIRVSKIKEFYEKAQVKRIPKSAINAMHNNNAVSTHQAPPSQNGLAHPRKSTATMVRSTSNRRLTTGSAKLPASKPPPAPSSNATVKRNATIIKRSTVPKRSIAPPASTLPSPPQQQHQHQQMQQQQQHNNDTTNNMGPPLPPAINALTTPVKPVFTTVVPNKIYKHGILDSIILKLISDRTDEVKDALVEIDEVLADDTEAEFKGRINQIIDLTTLQLVKSFECLKLTSQDENRMATQRIQKIYDLMGKVLARRSLVTAANSQSIRFLLLQLFTLAQCCGNINDDGTVRKILNNLAVVVMDSFEPATTMCILTGMLNEPTPSSIVTPVKDAIIRSMRSFK